MKKDFLLFHRRQLYFVFYNVKKFISLYFILLLTVHCLEAKKSPFDSNSSEGLIRSLVTSYLFSKSVPSAVPDTVPAISYSGSPFTFTKDLAISSITPTLTGTATSYSISPDLPSGLSFNSGTGQISGTPVMYGTASGWDVPKNYTVTAVNSAGKGTASISVTVRWMRPWSEIQNFLSNQAALGVSGAETTAVFGSLAGTNKWQGGVLASNGKIYGIPYDATNVLEIDPVANTVTTFGSLAGIAIAHF